MTAKMDPKRITPISDNQLGYGNHWEFLER